MTATSNGSASNGQPVTNGSGHPSEPDRRNGDVELTDIALEDMDSPTPVAQFYQDNKSPYSDKSNGNGNDSVDAPVVESKPVDAKERKYGFKDLFRYAHGTDYLLMVIGLILALGQGAAFPASLFLYAKILNALIRSMSCNVQVASQIGANSTIVSGNSGSDVWTVAGPICGYLALIGLGMFLAAIISNTFWYIAGERQVFRVRTRLFKAILSKDVAWFDKHRTGELDHVLFESVRKMDDGMTDKIPIAASWLSSCLSGFICAFVASWKVAIVAFSLVPLLLIVSILMIRLVKSYAAKQSKAYAIAGSIASELIGCARTVIAFNRQEYEVGRYRERLVDSQRMGMIKTVASGGAQGAMFLIIYSMMALSFWWGNSSQVGEQGGTVMQVLISLMIATMSLANAAPTFEAFGAAIAGANEVYAIIDEPSRIDNFNDTGMWLDSLRGDIAFENVVFRYPHRAAESPVLDGISLAIPRGKTVALVGPSGCGKSTCVQLVLRLYDVLGGRVTIDDIDIRDINVRWFRQQVGLVSQEPVLFNISIKENIKLGALDQAAVSDESVIAAAKLSNAHEFISRLPQGYDTLVGERGAQLSGGQKQRIAIARAVISNPRILVLDEATSALDTGSEAIVQDAFDRATRRRTTLVIAHRLSTIRNADAIVVMSAGKVVDMGTHEELMERRGLYYDLVESQQQQLEKADVTSTSDNSLDHNITAATGDATVNGTLMTTVLDDTAPNTTAISTKGLKGRKGSKKLSTASLEAQPSDASEEKPPSRLALLATVLRWNKPEVGFTVLCAFVSVLAGGVQPAYAILISEFLTSFCPGSESKFQGLLAALVCLGVANLILLASQHYLFAIISERLTTRLRCRLLGKILRQDAGWLDKQENQPSILTTVLATDCVDVQGMSGCRICLTLTAAVIMGVAIIYSLILDWRITLAILGLMPLIMICGVVYARLSVGGGGNRDEATGENALSSMDAIGNMRTVIPLAAEPFFLAGFTRRFKVVRHNAIRTGALASPMFGFTQAGILWSMAITYSLGTWLIVHGDPPSYFLAVVRIFTLITFSVVHCRYCALLPLYYPHCFALGRHSTSVPEMGKAAIAAVKLRKLLESKPTIDVEDPKTEESVAALNYEKPDQVQLKGRIEFRNVSFSYPTRQTVRSLDDVSFTVEVGQRVALCGPSGGGKSTIVQLIQRLYDPTGGSVQVEGVDIRQLNVRRLRSNIGLVAQEPVLFAASISDNIAYGSKEPSDRPSDDDIWHACQEANAAHFIDDLPEKIKTELGERGAQLSGGQKQRIAIARALVRRPVILLLDEATSALDTESERIVQAALDAVSVGRTCLVIAHRLSTIQSADKIIVLERGRVVEQGNHAELMALKGTYYKLQQIQNKHH